MYRWTCTLNIMLLLAKYIESSCHKLNEEHEEYGHQSNSLCPIVVCN